MDNSKKIVWITCLLKEKGSEKEKLFIYKIKKIPKKEKKGLTFAKKLSILSHVTFSHAHRVRYLKGKKYALNVAKFILCSLRKG